MGRIDRRIEALGIVLPQPWTPRGDFLPFRKEGRLVHLAGQICEWNGAVTCHGPVGPGGVSVEEAAKAARVCAINLLFTLKEACGGDLDRVVQVQRLGGFVAATIGFSQSPQVINGASAVFIDVFGEAGRHARTAVAVAGLPVNAAVEVDAIVVVD
ncbi:RidA family protein [Acuticoccus sp. M5D2P5]|uniref:RidA family protein n=1 Tax=Acuticoccus kalidii TaxID=2910977 RepID=UPI001F37A947|nr:RidA family protein [Acuticoccus kalidii]MCF3933098.1 RidA family protein [Acuticoccus kalidii]